MSRFIAIVAMFCLLASPAYARLRESKQECIGRYGRPVEIKKGPAQTETYLFEESPYKITISFKKNMASQITYRLSKGDAISLSRMEHLLHKNGIRKNLSGDGRSIWFFKRVGKDGAVYMVDRSNETTARYDIHRGALSIWVND